MANGLPEGTVTILFTDVEGSTALRSRAGDDQAQATFDVHDQVIRQAISDYGGQEIKSLGDGFMIGFRSVGRALSCAMAIQRTLDEHGACHPEQAVRVRMGLNSGEVRRQADDVFGLAVNAAARIADKAKGGEILVSEGVRQLMMGISEIPVRLRGRFVLKGFAERWRLYEVAWREAAAPRPEGSTGAAAGVHHATAGWSEQGSGSRLSEPDVRPVLCPTLIGRRDEREALMQVISDAEQSLGTMVLLLGEAGVGKSRLAREMVSDAVGRGWTIFSGRAVESATPSAFRPFAEALMSTLRTRGLPDSPELGPFRSALGRLVPEWGQPGPVDANESIVVLAEGILRLLRCLANGHGSLLLLEDLHWADPETLAIVEYLADHLSSEPVLCVATLRTEEASAALALARTLRARRRGLVLELGRLSEPDVAAVAEACLGGEPLPVQAATALSESAEGNPFLIEELLAAWVATGVIRRGEDGWRLEKEIDVAVPLSFLDTVRRRLGPLGPAGGAVLGAAAVLGRRFDWTLLPVVTALPEAAVLDVLRSAIDAQLIAPDGSDDTAFKFRHALTRDAIVDTLLPPHRRALCGTALQAINDAHPGLPGAWGEVAAELALGSGDARAASELFVELGRRERGRGALGTAEAAFVRARSILDVDTASDASLVEEIERDLCEVLALAGKPDDAAAVGAELLGRLVRRGAPPTDQVQVHLRLARGDVAAARWDVADDHLAAVAALSPAGDNPAVDADRAALLARVAIGREDIVLAHQAAEIALEEAERVGQAEQMCDALEVLGRCQRRSDLDAAEATLDRAWRIAWDHRLQLWQIRILLELGGVDLVRGNPITRLDEASRLAREAGALATACDVDVQRSFWFFNHYRLDEMLAAARQCEAVAARFQMDAIVAVANGLQALAHTLRQNADEARRTLQVASDLAPPDSPWGAGREVQFYISATAWLLRDDARLAGQELDRARAAMVHGGSAAPYRGIWALLHTLVDSDDGIDARAEIRASVAGPLHLVQAFLDYGEAVCAGRSGDVSAANAFMASADREMRASPWFFHLSRRLVADGAIEDSWGEPTSWLRDALAFFEGEGHEHLARACRSLLTKLGDSSVRRRRSGDLPPELAELGVTRRELDVLELLADGRPTKEIAAQLYLSPKTVERHIANLATKAGVPGRAQLVAFAAGWTTRRAD